MIENFIEKDIIRQVKLTEYLYELKVLSVREVAKRLDVTFNTVKRDFEKISIILEEYIDQMKTSSTTIQMTFLSSFSRYDLIKEVYKESKFLRGCSWYLMGETNYLTIVEEEFVSVAKAFKIKKKVEEYFKSSNIMDEEGQLIENELAYRFVMMSVWMRCDLLDTMVDKTIYKRVSIFVEQVLNHLVNDYEMNRREYTFLMLAAYLSLSRKDTKTLVFPEEEFNFLKDTMIFNQIKEVAGLVLGENQLSEPEIAFFVSIYRSINLNTNNYLIVNMNYMQKREIFIESRPRTVKKLIKQIEDEFNANLTNNILFEKPFMNYLNTLWYNIQNYTVEKHYYLSDSQLAILATLKKIFNQWKEEIQLDYELKLNDTSLEKLCSEIESSLTQKRPMKFAIIIVAEDELSHVVYRENISRWLNMDYYMIDNTMYYSLNDVPIYADEWPHVIICERSLVFEENTKPTNLFSISKSTLLEDIKRIFLYIYDWK